MICRARGCFNFAMPKGPENPKGLCGVCHEQDEEYPVRLKSGPGGINAEVIAKRNETRRRNREAKQARWDKAKGEAA